MAPVYRSIFRDHAFQQYMQRQEREVLACVAWPPVGFLYGIVLGLLLLAGCFAWHEQIPAYIAGSGVILGYDQGVVTRQNEALALVFLPASAYPKAHTGQPIHLQTTANGLSLTGRVEKVEPGIINPLEALTHYHLGRSGAQIVTQPSIVLLVRVSLPSWSHVSVGSSIHAQFQNGFQPIFSLLLEPGGEK